MLLLLQSNSTVGSDSPPLPTAASTSGTASGIVRTVSSTPATVIDLIPDVREVRVTVSYLVRQHKKSNKRQFALFFIIIFSIY
jgi:hypothetical protein